MKVRLSLVGAPEPSDYVFGEEGGLFGRSGKCQWALPDPECILSAVHGRVYFSNGRFVLVDESTNGILPEGRSEPLGRGNSIVLQDRLRFRAAKYLIEAQLIHEAARPAPVEQPFDLAQPAPSPWPDAPIPQARPAALAGRGEAWGKESQDPLAYLDGGGLPVDAPAARAPAYPPQGLPVAGRNPNAAGFGGDPLFDTSPSTSVVGGDGRLDDLFADTPAPRAPAAPPARPIPEPLPAFTVTEPPPPRPVSVPSQPAAAVIPPPAASKAIPEDFLASFGMRKDGAAPLAPMPAPVAVQPAAPSRAPAASPAFGRIPDDFDPLTSLGAAPRGPGPQRPAPVAAPPAPVNPPAAPPIPRAAQPEALSPALLADFVRVDGPVIAPRAAQAGGDEPFDALEAMKSRREERKAALIEKAKGNGSALPPLAFPPSPPPPAAVASPPPRFAEPPLAPAAPAAPIAANPAPVVPRSGTQPSDTAILTALLVGMGFPAARVPPENGEKIAHDTGQLVRETAEGLIALLAARRMLKAEFRMDETQVQPEENNPFKYFKIAELALDELFLTRSGGFQAPGEAVSSAFEDLQQHAMLTMSAMQRAINLLFKRLSPDAIAEDDGGHRIRGLGARKGKWETYVENHARMSGNIDGIARQIIAEAFAQVQEEQARKAASAYWETKQ